MQGLAIGSTQITVQAAAYNDGTGNVTVNPSGFWLNASDFSRDVFAANQNIQLRSSLLNPTTLNRAQDQEVRGGHSVSVSLNNSNPAVGILTVNPVIFTGGAGAAVNTAFDPLAAGSTVISLVQPAGFDIPANVNSSITATVTGAIPIGQVNLTQAVTTTATASTEFSASFPATDAVDGILGTGSSWCTANNDPAPQLTVEFDSNTTVSTLYIAPYQVGSSTYDYLTGQFALYDASDTLLYDSGVVTLSDGSIELDVSPDVSTVRKVVFDGVTWNSIEPCLSEFAVIGTAP